MACLYELSVFGILLCSVFFFNDTATTEIYTLSLHDALPISPRTSQTTAARRTFEPGRRKSSTSPRIISGGRLDRKSTRLNSSHANISYAVFCLKKKKRHASRVRLAGLVVHCWPMAQPKAVWK